MAFSSGNAGTDTCPVPLRRCLGECFDAFGTHCACAALDSLLGDLLGNNNDSSDGDSLSEAELDDGVYEDDDGDDAVDYDAPNHMVIDALGDERGYVVV